MANIPWISAEEVGRLVSMSDAVVALRDAFAAGLKVIPRTHVGVTNAEFVVMPAVTETAFGAKLLTIVPANAGTSRPVITGLYVLLNAVTGEPTALLDGAALTSLRTPAASAVATDALARADVSSIGILGTGPQAHAHAVAMRVVRPSANRVVIAGRTSSRVDAVVAGLRADGFDARAGSFLEAAACDVVNGCTRSDAPLFGAASVRRGAHLNLVGAYRLDLREVAADVVAASTVVVDELAAARAEAGDLEIAVQEGAWSWDRVAGDLGDAAAGRVVRSSNSEITLFKSVGLAVQDLVVARLAAARFLGVSL